MAREYIKQAAVIGAGTMGSQIAATVANTDTKVLLLDIVPQGANDRDMLSKKAIEKLKHGTSLFNEKKAEHIQPGNMEDDLDKLRQADWVIECVPEDEKIKHETYEKIGSHTDSHTLISSNTSTLPLHKLKEGLKNDVQKRLCITHFFNPPTKMPLLELVTDQDNDPRTVAAFTDFADRMLGKNVVIAKDTPGFIANRIGIFWLLGAMEEAHKENISIEMADAVMNGAFGFPKTGVFALADLIGLKLIPDIVDSMCEFLPKRDLFCELQDALKLVQQQIDKGDTGKSHPGFYKEEQGKKQVLDLNSGDYRPIQTPDLSIEHWHEFLEQDSPESRFACHTLVRSLGYAAQVAPEIADNILDIDTAMRDGYGWKYGPFEMIDRLGVSWFIEQMQKYELHPPEFLKQAEEQGFYPHRTGMGKQYLRFSGRYRIQKIKKDKWTLAMKTAGSMPVMEGETARLWDIDDGIACCEITTKMSVIDERTLAFLQAAIDRVETDFKGMIIGHDGKHFSAGLDLRIIMECADKNDWKRTEDILKQGQDAWLRVKTARIPIVPALCGYVLGGACELTMHCVAAQAHSLTRIGLVETDIGVIPAWGGTKEHLVRAARQGDGDANKAIEEGVAAFCQIAGAKKSANAEDAIHMKLLTDLSHISYNRNRLLPDAKRLCLKLAEHYQPRQEAVIKVPVEALYKRLKEEIMAMTQQEQPEMTKHRHHLLDILAEVLSGHASLEEMQYQGNEEQRAGWNELSERQVLESTRKAFLELVQSEKAMEKIRAVVMP